MKHSQRDGVIAILFAVIGYSFLPVFAKTLLARGLEPLDLAVWRYGFAVPIFWLLSMRQPVPATAKLSRVRVLATGSLLALAALAGFLGFQRLPAGTYVVLFYSYPAMVAVIALVLGERLPLQGWAALGLTLVGIALTAPDFSAGLAGDNLSGVVFAMLNALIVAVYFLVTSRLFRGYPNMARASAWTVTGSLVLLIALGVWRGVAVPNGTDAWMLLIAMALVSTVLPVFSLNVGIQKLGATRAAIVGTIEPLLTAVLALLFLGETMQPIQWFGGVCIIASVILLQARRPARMRAEPVATSS
jgi:drug/metabolite transporter (DMT)-like permease